MTSKGIQDKQLSHKRRLGALYGDTDLKAGKLLSATEKRRAETLHDQYIRELSSYKIKLLAGILAIVLFFLVANIVAGWNLFGAFISVIIVSYTIFCLLSNRRE